MSEDLREYEACASAGPWQVEVDDEGGRRIVDAGGNTVATGVSFEDAQLIVRLRAEACAIVEGVEMRDAAKAERLEARRLVRRIAGAFDIPRLRMMARAPHANILGEVNALLQRVHLLREVVDAATDFAGEVLWEDALYGDEESKAEVYSLARKTRDAIDAYHRALSRDAARV